MSDANDQNKTMGTLGEEMTDEEMQQFFHLDPPLKPPSQSSHVLSTIDPVPLNASREIPTYLSAIDERGFVRMIEQHIPSVDRPLNREDVRQAAILTHHLTILELEQSLWTCYLKCGTGTLTSSTADRTFWPASVVTMVTELASDNDCLRFVQRRMSDLANEERALREQWNQKKKQIYDYARIWEEPLRASVVEQTESFRQNVRYQIQVVEFDYHIHQLESEFRQERPSATQVERATHLLDLKYQCENARQEVLLLKERIAQNKLPPSFDALQEPAPHSFRSLSDIQLGQQLSDRQQAILQHHRKEMIALYLDATEAKRDESRTLFNETMDNMQERQRILFVPDRFSPTMIHLLDRQLALITAKLECIYCFKIQQLSL